MGRMTRRRFLGVMGVGAACGLGVAAGLLDRRWWEREVAVGSPRPTPSPPTRWSTEAEYYTPVLEEGTLNCASCHGGVEPPLPVAYCHTPHTGTYVRCNLCPHGCFIAEGERGQCRARENQGGRLFSVVYGNPCAVHVDPIEKKPFYHFLPTAAAFSLATAGCNLRCLYCQNWQISQFPPEETRNADLPPEEVVRYAQMTNAPVIAYTYSEPVVFYEYMLTTARLAREAGLLNVVISAGFINPEPLRELCAAVDAIKIDLKGYDEEFYREVCGAELGPVLEAIRIIYESGTHLEIVNLVVPTLNDDLNQLRALSRWVARDLSPDVPLHFTRFHPQYKLTNLPPTPVESLEKARAIALEEGVRFVYVGNVPGHPANTTYCPVCRRPIVVRQGFAVREYHLQGGACAYCGESIPGVWWPGEPEGEPVEVAPGPPDQ
ncbi:MAG TPA: AmmeMemoRadiSam system radical SAM enzyme [Anaerolineales bacterium]|nr:AmmeMemoRadiSam system radical SAM enzyme [Anaerolineae bacterium]HIQ01012.1 AmmeMemoRadiSam system radical SAM enzyme [Anaerolineales bacterium]